ncbi:MAG: cyclic nucleotide-binding domain-containing protein [Actinomycetota bacterium]
MSATTTQSLRELPIFEGADDRELTEIETLVDEIEVLSNEALVREGDPGEESFIILSGSAEVSIGGSRVATLGPGAFFGEMAILEGKPRAATVTAKTPMRLLVISGEDFQRFIQQPGVAAYMLREIVSRLRATQQPRPTRVPSTASADYTLSLNEGERLRFHKMAEHAAFAESDAWARAGIIPGARIADVGCGPGAMTVRLASIVGPNGRVDAVDRDLEALANAEACVKEAEVSNVRFFTGEAVATGLEPGMYDAVMMRHVLLHNCPDIPIILEHVITLLKPGGCVFLVESDLLARRMVPIDPDLDEEFNTMIRLWELGGNDPSIGSKLASIVRQSGLELIEFDGRFDIWPAELMMQMHGPAHAARPAMFAAGLASTQDAIRWDEAREKLIEDPDGKYMCIPMFRATGRKPEAL